MFSGICWIASFLLYAALSSRPARLPPPAKMVWSWYTPDDFRQDTPANTGVAWLAISLNFARSGVAIEPRANPVYIPKGMYEMAVVRFNFHPAEARSESRALWLPANRVSAEEAILDLVKLTGVKALQIDFDAPASARTFYFDLLRSLRSKLPRDTFLSITALVSWCMEPKSWLSSLPVDEYVPMAFDMGAAGDDVTSMLRRGGVFPFPGCRTSLGTRMGSDDLPPTPKVRRYQFRGGIPWNAVTASP